MQAFQHHYAWSEEDPSLAAAGDLGMPMFCFETAIKASVAQGAAVPQAECTACLQGSHLPGACRPSTGHVLCTGTTMR